jgi:hypothetical protein
MVHSSKFPDSASSVGDVISHSDNTLSALFRHAKSLTRVESLLSGYISPELACRFQVASMRQDRLVLLAPASSWATRLRMQAEQMLQFLQASGYAHLRHIDIRVAPLATPPTQNPVRRSLSPAAELAFSLMSRLTGKDPGG